MPSILFISPSDFIYQPRIVKAAHLFEAEGYSINIFTPVLFNETFDKIEQLKKTSSWVIIPIDYRKGNTKGKLNWFIATVIHILSRFIKSKINSDFFPGGIMNKNLALTGSLYKSHYDVIVTNVVDSLPLAVKVKSKNRGSKLIFDSQEYFTGQYEANKSLLNLVEEIEKKCLPECDLITTTTNVLADQLKVDYKLDIPLLRVRNTPATNELPEYNFDKNKYDQVKVVWSGVTINYKSERGIHIIVEAMKYCRENIVLYLQGKIKEKQKKLLNDAIESYGLKDKVKLIPAAKPEKYLQSLIEYDIGVLGELAENKNQLLTSSNKLFYYIGAGLAVVGPDLPGIKETLGEYEVGLFYETGNAKSLAEKLNYLADNIEQLNALRKNSIKFSRTELYWENDYKKVMEALK